MRALIVGEGTGALAVVRELGRAGWTVGVASDQRFGLGSVSRWCARRHHVPPPLGDLGGFTAGVNAAARAAGYEIVFGAGDAEVLALSARRQDIAPRFPYGPHESVLEGFDKLSLARLAERFGIRSPRTRAASPESLDDVDYPCVVKPRLHWTPGLRNDQTRVEACLVSDKPSALRQSERMRALGAAPLLQAYVPGRTMVLTTLVDDHGSIVSSMMQVATHQGRRMIGTNYRAVSVTVDQELQRRCLDLLNEIRWFGLACLQFQLTNDGTPFLIDFNGRMVEDSALASASGMRGHDAWARLAMGLPAAHRETVLVPEGRRYQDIEGDVRHVILGGTGRRRLPAELFRILRDSATSVHPVLSRDDIRPLISYLVRTAGRLVKRICRGAALNKDGWRWKLTR